jgi:predicted secreted protein
MKKIVFVSALLFLLALIACATVKMDREYEVKKGEDFVINLKSKPSTGYTWMIEKGLSDSIVTLEREEFEPVENPTDKPRLGAGGTKKWYFYANKRGKTILKFIYKRPGSEETTKIKHFSVHVK